MDYPVTLFKPAVTRELISLSQLFKEKLTN